MSEKTQPQSQTKFDEILREFDNQLNTLYSLTQETGRISYNLYYNPSEGDNEATPGELKKEPVDLYEKMRARIQRLNYLNGQLEKSVVNMKQAV